MSHDPSDETEIPLRRTDAAFDADKARRAARNTARPGERCRAEPGRCEPVVDRARCEGKSECVAVCPYDVFEVRTIAADEYRALPVLARLKLWAHGKQTAYTPRAADCRACGLCVVACPEHAIALVRADADSTLLSGQ